jgi:hypothetical protein
MISDSPFSVLGRELGGPRHRWSARPAFLTPESRSSRVSEAGFSALPFHGVQGSALALSANSPMLLLDRREEAERHEEPSDSSFDFLRDLIGIVTDAPADWSEEHDHYIHGSPRRHPPD